MELAEVERKARERYDDDEVVAAAKRLGNQIGAFAAEDELTDEAYVAGLVEIILSVAPHQALMEAFREIATSDDPTVEDMKGLLAKTRVAELASYGQLALQRVQSIGELEEVIRRPDVSEADLQELIARAPWLIKPDWSVISDNQPLKTFRRQFESYFESHYQQKIEVAISHENKRPDFTVTGGSTSAMNVGVSMSRATTRASSHSLRSHSRGAAPKSNGASAW
ncbi:MAG: hypothetical protein ACRDY0_03400 [Acidimicrobiales bacterium]